MSCKKLLFLLCLLVPSAALSQNICRISNAEGLSNSSILSIGQDANGYIWAGSCDGINLWDGASVRNFKLSGNLIQQIIPTDDGYLWVRTNYGLDRLDTRDYSIEQYTEFPRVYLFTACGRDEAFFVSGGRLFGYLPSRKKFEVVDSSQMQFNNIRLLCCDRDRRLWALDEEGISCAKITREEDGAPQVGFWDRILICEGIDFAAYDNDRGIYFIDKTGRLYRFDMTRQRAVLIYDLSQEIRVRGDVSSVVRDKDDYVIAFEMNGVIRLHSATRIEGDYLQREIDVDCGVFALLKDRNQDIVWIGTDGSGLLRQSDGDISVRSITYNSLPYPLSKPIKSLFVDRGGELWIGTKNDGILCIDDFYNCRNYTRENTRSFTMANSALKRNSVYRFASSRRNLLWIAGDGGVSYYSYRNQSISALSGGDALRNVHDLYESDDSTLWVATVGHGFFRVTLSGSDTPHARSVEPVDPGEDFAGRNFFFCITPEADSVVWFGNHGVGAVRYDLRAHKSKIVRFDDRRGHAVNDVTSIARCGDGTLWFATGCGVEHAGPSGEPLPTPEYNHDILRDGVMHGVLADSLGNVWISTNAGIVRYNPRTNRSVSYGATYGLKVVEFSDGAYFYDRRAKTLLFGGINGFVTVSDTEAPAAGSYMPPILFREVTTNGATYGLAGLMRRDRLVLNHRQSAFSLSLAALDYINGSNYSYLYNIKGFNDGWNDNGHNNQLVFANLPAGRYTLNVRYRNNMNGEMSPVYSLAIRIKPPLYASAWAWVLYVAVAVGGLSAAVFYWMRRRRERTRRRREFYEQRQKELVYESRISSFANLTSELSIPLTLINGPCQQILDCNSADSFVRRQADFIRRNAQKLNDLIFMINEFKSAGAADRSDDIELLNVSRFAESISISFDEYARTNGVSYRAAIPDGLFFPSASNALTMVLNILLTNAFRRTSPEGEVSLRVSIEDDSLQIAVSNRGQMLDPRNMEALFDRYRMFDYFEDLGRKGLSLKDDMELVICRNSVLKLQGELQVLNQNDVTTFRVVLPRLEITRTTQHEVQSGLEPQRRLNLPALTARPARVYSASLPTMLVVNEDRDMTEFITDLFSGDYNVQVIGELESVQERLRESHPQIIVCGTVALDGSMSGVIRQIRQNKHLAQIPVILLSAAPRADVKIEGLELGVDICLTLPFNITHLRSVADQLLRKYESLKDYGRSVFNAFDLTQGRMLHKDDRAFLDRMLEVIHKNILNAELSTQFIAGEMNMSLCNLYRRLATVTDQTPAGIIRDYRLCMAEQLLLTTKLSIDEIIYKSGFINRSTFFRSFTARFGSTPKAYREQKIREAIDSEAL